MTRSSSLCKHIYRFVADTPSSSDVATQQIAGLKKLDPERANLIEGWACVTTWTYSDGTRLINCVYYGGGGGGLPPAPIPPDPLQPPTFDDDCMQFGVCGGIMGPGGGPPVPGDMPPGFPATEWTNLTREEQILCYEVGTAICVSLGVKSHKARQKADSAAQANNMVAYNNIYDAYRHAYWQALTRRHHGLFLATAIGNAHESESTQHDQVCMDQANNKVGRDIASAHPTATDDLLWVKVTNSPLLKPAPYTC